MRYRLGVDGGGSKTEAILVGSDGSIAARGAGSGCNPSIIGVDGAKRLVVDVLKQMLAPLTQKDPDFTIETTLLCMAGNRAFWQEFARSLTSFGRVTAMDDSVPVLELAAGSGPGIVLHAGTGSFVAARDLSGNVHYAGGLGWRFGDPGSGYDIARRAISRALLELQGWFPRSGLSKLVTEQTGIPDPQALSRFFYNDSAANPKISQFAPAVLELAASGDPAAGELAADSAAELLDLGMSVAAKLFPDRPLGDLPAALSGPVLTHPFLVEKLTAGSALRLSVITEPPIEGVRRLLARV